MANNADVRLYAQDNGGVCDRRRHDSSAMEIVTEDLVKVTTNYLCQKYHCLSSNSLWFADVASIFRVEELDTKEIKSRRRARSLLSTLKMVAVCSSETSLEFY
jgi:hypothetical protein